MHFGQGSAWLRPRSHLGKVVEMDFRSRFAAGQEQRKGSKENGGRGIKGTCAQRKMPVDHSKKEKKPHQTD